jgi:3',5'-cyclic AMP phosphodiesterase CpdA
MHLDCRFAVISDPHIALPRTVWDHPSRFHLVELSIPALEQVLTHLEQLELDFLLLPGDLTQHGETENHRWLAEHLSQLPFPAFVIPGNHDLIRQQSTATTIGVEDFPRLYAKFGYQNASQLYYTCELKPGLHLIGLNSIQFNEAGEQLHRGSVDSEQLTWLRATLADLQDQIVLVMIHHNVIEHMPGQGCHRLGQRYLLENQAELLACLQASGANLILTGHLHVQDIAQQGSVYDITTGSLVSYPHPYRVLKLHTDDWGQQWLQVESHRVESLPGWPTLQATSRQWMGDRSLPFVLRLLTEPPLSLSVAEAESLAADLRYFWADLANGDAVFSFPNFPATARSYFEAFSALGCHNTLNCIDNYVSLRL